MISTGGSWENATPGFEPLPKRTAKKKLRKGNCDSIFCVQRSKDRYGQRKAPYRAACVTPDDTELQPFRLYSLSGSARLIRAPGEKAARVHRGRNHSDRAGCRSLHPPHFACAQRCHALGRVIDLLSAVQANLVSLLLERERPSLTPVAAAKENVVEKTKQILNPFHKMLPCLQRRVCR